MYQLRIKVVIQRTDFIKKLACVFDNFPKYHMKILKDFKKEDNFKPTNGNESLYEISNDNGVRVVNFSTSKKLIVKRTMFPCCSIHSHTWTSPDRKTHSHMDR